MSISVESAQERIDYAAKYGEKKACKHYKIQLESLRKYRNLIGRAETDKLEFKDILKGIAPIDWTQWPQIDGDVMVFNDSHLPFANWELLDKALRVADMLAIDQAVWLGDLVDCEAISPFDFGADIYPFLQELEIGREFLLKLRKRFKRMILIRGNHEERLVRFLKRIKKVLESATKNTEYDSYYKIITGEVPKKPWEYYRDFFQSDGVEVSNYPLIEIDGKYLGVHPSNYSRIPPSVEKKLSNKYLKHVIGTHGHLSALGFHDSGQFIDIQLGGIVKKELIFYKGMKVTTHPEWVAAFGWIKDGKLGYYFDHPDLLQIFDYVH